jgi:hypothetical protein
MLMADSFMCFLLVAALAQDDDRDRVFELLGKDALVKSRNHYKLLRRELSRVEEFCRVLGGRERPLVSPPDDE